MERVFEQRCIRVALRLMSCRSCGVNDGRLPPSIRGPHECRRMGFFLFSIPSPCYPVLSGMQEMVAEHFLSVTACVNDSNAHWASRKPIQVCFYSLERLFRSRFCCLRYSISLFPCLLPVFFGRGVEPVNHCSASLWLAESVWWVGIVCVIYEFVSDGTQELWECYEGESGGWSWCWLCVGGDEGWGGSGVCFSLRWRLLWPVCSLMDFTAPLSAPADSSGFRHHFLFLLLIPELRSLSSW